MATIPLFVLVTVALAAVIMSFPQLVTKRQNFAFALLVVTILATAAYIGFLAFVVAVSLIPLMFFLFAFGALIAKLFRK